MSTAIAKADFTPDQVSLIQRTICKGSTPDELKLFLGQCQRTGLDPFSKQIHAVKRWDGKAQREVMAIQVGVDGFRLVAERTEQTDGQEGPFWCDVDGQWSDVWVHNTPPMAAKVIVYRKGQSRGYTGIAHWNEYHQTTRDGAVTTMWARMPALMLAKCAECLALRKAFPQELSGLYSPEEMAQSTTVDAEVVNARSEDAEVQDHGDGGDDHSDHPDHPDAELVNEIAADYGDAKNWNDYNLANAKGKKHAERLSGPGKAYLQKIAVQTHARLTQAGSSPASKSEPKPAPAPQQQQQAAHEEIPF